ncbi:MAG TPA: fructosamine kinase family protein [Chitinophagaceae bacterium]|nr:fructosamine kinase family protein [Chitinophagaceae bacterium]
MIVQRILNDLGLAATKVDPVSGGDINKAYCLHTGQGRFFLKVNEAHHYPAMMEKEARGLLALQQNGFLQIPAIVKSGMAGNHQYLLLEWIEKGQPGPGCWKDFGSGLARMHKQDQLHFGWEEPNYIGSLPQYNESKDDWPSFYQEQRIIPLVKRLFEEGVFGKADLKMSELLCNKLENLFPAEAPALLHGDLWAGNYRVCSNGKVAIFDPAVYCGHREMDIGMSRLFGGFSSDFYSAYHEVYPLEKGWEQRLPLAQLYPLLVHALLFGGHYPESARDILVRFS